MSLPEAPPQAIVIFGASGDLTRRKILPALYQLASEGGLPEKYAIVGYARSEMDDDAFRAEARAAVEEHGRTPIDEEHWAPFAESLRYVSGSFERERCFGPLHDFLEQVDRERGTEGRRLFYCATPPSAFPLIAERLGECGQQTGNAIVVEKPFGRDLESARELNAIVHEVFDESQIYRIDHYLGKETVQNIVVLRFANSMFERVWNRDAIDHVQITVAESAGMAGRGSYYEESGAARDMVQSHLLQLMAFIAMDPPRALEAEAVRDEKVKLLRAVRPFAPDEVVRGQYVSGSIDGEDVDGYRAEEGVARGSKTETFVAIRAHVDNWRWADVPFYLRTGKRLPRRVTEIAVVFRKPPLYLLEDMGVESPPPNELVIQVQPDETVSFTFQAKELGRGFRPKTVRMDFAYDEYFKKEPAEAYERLLHDAMVGDRTLFTREDEVERSWQIVAPLFENPSAVEWYEAGSWGPEHADVLIAPRRWHTT